MMELLVTVLLVLGLVLGSLWHKRRMYRLETERRALAAVDRDLYGIAEYPRGRFTLRSDAFGSVKYVDGVVKHIDAWGKSERPPTEDELETVRKMAAAREQR